MRSVFVSALTVLLLLLALPASSQESRTAADARPTRGDTMADIVFLCPPCGMPCDSTVHAAGGTCAHCGMTLRAGYRELAGKSLRGHFQNARGQSAAVLIFPGVEIIDFGPQIEIFGQAGMRVFTVAAADTAITTAMGLRVVPRYTYDNAPDADLVVLPGGHVEHEDARTLAWIRKAHDRATHVLTVCNGAFFLAQAGLLDGKEATTFAGSIRALQELAPRAKVVNDRRYVDNGKIVTSAGLAAGIDAAFHILGKYEGRGRAQEVATFLEYDWDAEGRFVRAQLADRHLRPLDDAIAPFMVRTNEYRGNRSEWLLDVTVTTELISIEKIVRLLEHQWSSGTNWKKTKQAGLGSQWSLRQENGERWNGELRVAPRGEDYVVTVSVRKS
jgi:putative intracellular protease/amidase